MYRVLSQNLRKRGEDYEYDYMTIHDAINDISEFGWEEGDEELLMTQYTIVNVELQVIEAVGFYTRKGGSSKPVLVWAFPTGNVVRKYEDEYADYIRKEAANGNI